MYVFCGNMLLVAVFTLAAAFVSAGAWAGGDESDGEVRVITVDGRSSTSTCIGNPNTPACAIDTFWACTVWDDAELCEQAGRRISQPNPDFNVNSIEYIFVDAEVIEESDIPPDLAWVDWIKPGFVDVTFKLRYFYNDTLIDPADGWHTYSFTLEQVGGDWHVVSYALWGFEDFMEQFPEEQQ